jgi:hypothetical protein
MEKYLILKIRYSMSKQLSQVAQVEQAQVEQAQVEQAQVEQAQVEQAQVEQDITPQVNLIEEEEPIQQEEDELQQKKKLIDQIITLQVGYEEGDDVFLYQDTVEELEKKLYYLEIERKATLNEDYIFSQDQHSFASTSRVENMSDHLIELIQNEIRSGTSSPELKNYLLLLPIEKLSVEDSNQLLHGLIQFAGKEMNTLVTKKINEEAVRDILTRFSGSVVGFDEYIGDMYPILSYLFVDEKFPFETLQYIYYAVIEVVPMSEIALDIMHLQDGGPSAIEGLQRLFEIFGRPDGETERLLYSEALSSRNQAALDYITSFQKFYQEPSDKPMYLVNPLEDGLYEERMLLDQADLIAKEINESNESEEQKKVNECKNLLTNQFKKYYSFFNISIDKDIIQDYINETPLGTLYEQSLPYEGQKQFLIEFIQANGLTDVVPKSKKKSDIEKVFTEDNRYNILQLITFLVNYFSLNLQKYGFSVDQTDVNHEKLLDFLFQKSILEIQSLLSQYLFQDKNTVVATNPELFLILGPCHTLKDSIHTDSTNICFRFGGCRMYYCNCFEEHDDSQTYFPNIPTWFKGECDTCHKMIPKRMYAVRKPLPSGGWYGTYCSFTCLNNDPTTQDILTQDYITQMEKDLNEIKVWDRNEINVEQELLDAQQKTSNHISVEGELENMYPY